MLCGEVELAPCAFDERLRRPQRPFGKELYAEILVGNIFAVLEWQEHKTLLAVMKAAPSAIDERCRNFSCLGVIGKCFARGTEDISRKLIEENNEGDLLLTGKIVQVPFDTSGFANSRTEIVANMVVGLVRFFKPDSCFFFRKVIRPSERAKPVYSES